MSADVMNKYPLTSKNDAFNSYSVNVFFGLMHTIPVSIQLTKISDAETKVMLSGVLSPYIQNLHIAANEAIDKYANLLGKTLTGEHVNNPANKGCATMIIALLIISLLLFSFGEYIVS